MCIRDRDHNRCAGNGVAPGEAGAAIVKEGLGAEQPDPEHDIGKIHPEGACPVAPPHLVDVGLARGKRGRSTAVPVVGGAIRLMLLVWLVIGLHQVSPTMVVGSGCPLRQKRSWCQSGTCLLYTS